MPTALPLEALETDREFAARHIGPDAADEARMLGVIGAASREALMQTIVPAAIRRPAPMDLPAPAGEAQALAELKAIAAKNRVLKSFIGQGYYGTHTPGVILRNILENPAWYTAYTPYQAEISQGRMEALVNFQTMVCDLTGMSIANASMLDEATAAAEARAAALAGDDYFAAFAQYPASSGWLHDWTADAATVHGKQAAFIVASDLLALTLLKTPGEMGADIVVGNTQRFGVPMGAGGPHAGFLACRDEYKRSMPGRLVGVSVDSHGNPAYRLALQTREQHIRREKATSNICTAQVLPAVIASMYAVYHGPEGLKRIALRVASYTAILAKALGAQKANAFAFDTLEISTGAQTEAIVAKALAAGMNFRRASAQSVSISLDETSTREDLKAILAVFDVKADLSAFERGIAPLLPAELLR